MVANVNSPFHLSPSLLVVCLCNDHLIYKYWLLVKQLSNMHTTKMIKCWYISDKYTTSMITLLQYIQQTVFLLQYQ